MRRTRLTAVLAGGAFVLAACGSGSGASAPTWEPSPGFGSNGEGPGVQITPIVPVPSLSPQGGGTPAPGASGSTRPSTSSTADPDVVATKLTTPTAVAILPDNSALVGERTTGRIVRVQPRPDQPVPTVRVLPGLSTAGGGGLLDLALSPSYGEDNLIYAYITTPKDNRVVDFTLHGPVTPVLTGIPKGRSDNTGRIAFGADGNLYVGTGDAGVAGHASDGRSLAGKVLRVTDIGRPAAGNPNGASPIWTSGHRVVNGLCAVAQTNGVLEVETGAAGRPDAVNGLVGGANYGWPHGTGAVHAAAAALPAQDRAPGGCAVADSTLWVTSLNGTALLAAQLSGGAVTQTVGKFTEQLRGKYGRLLTVVAAADGALWLTTSNRDGHGRPVAADERVIRYVPSSSTAGRNPA
ncbi:PQQ-dependent sugar dehydrogenase [uncultured Jatrophihabitans sp.]|uniref:PQQ-dependent sugar dehydrogenase n=1 Tax=uncultured Jatrophihabitans sp. TaxID=1610747 RepID=UPI0035C94356